MLVDIACTQVQTVEPAQERRHLAGRDLRYAPVPERLHDPALEATRASLVRRPWLRRQVAVLLQRRGLRTLLALYVLEPLRRQLAHRDAAFVSFPFAAFDLRLEHVVLSNQLGHPHGRPLLVEVTLRHPPAPRLPSTAVLVLGQPGASDAPLHLATAAAPLGLVEGTTFSDSDDQRAGGIRRHTAEGTTARVPLFSRPPPVPLWVPLEGKTPRFTALLAIQIGLPKLTSVPRDTLQAGGHRSDPGWLHS